MRKFIAMLALAALMALGLGAAAAIPANAVVGCGNGFTTYTPYINQYGGVTGGVGCAGGGSPTWVYTTCVEYWDGSSWQNADWTCSDSLWDSSPLFCNVYYRTWVSFTYYGYWMDNSSPNVILC